MIFKLYRRAGHNLHYREAWDTDNAIVEHWGICGTRGEIRQHQFEDATDRVRIFSSLLSDARANGFEPISDEQHHGLLVQRSVDGHGTSEDVERRHLLEGWLNDQLGWLGLGHCDGGSMGSGSMEAFCPVVDYEIAAKSLAPLLALSPFADFSIQREAVLDE